MDDDTAAPGFRLRPLTSSWRLSQAPAPARPGFDLYSAGGGTFTYTLTIEPLPPV